MQQRPSSRATAPVWRRPPVARASFFARASTSLTRQQRSATAFWLLLLLCIGLELLYLALYPLLAASVTPHDALLQPWQILFPWLPALHPFALLPASWQHSLPWLQSGSRLGTANSILILVMIAVLVSLFAAFVNRSAGNVSLSRRGLTVLIGIVGFFTCLFALTMLFSPPSLQEFQRDMLLSWSAGRVVVNYHLNPYLVTPANFPHDVASSLLHALPGDAGYLPDGSIQNAGPVWVDMSILVSLVVHDQAVEAVLGFRLICLLAYLGNVALIWIIVRKVKPELRMFVTVLYAWNPLVLLLGIAYPHPIMLLTLFLLLALFFFLNDALVLCWFFLFLAVLVNLAALLLVPLFIRGVQQRIRLSHWGWQTLSWLGFALLTGIVLVLAYAPYWNGWGWQGLVTGIMHVFLPDKAVNSLDAALRSLPLPAQIQTALSPRIWMIGTLIVIAVLTLFSLWLADTFELLVLCASWVWLLFVVLHPIYWPWYTIPLLALAVCSAQNRTILLSYLLSVGGLVSYYFWLLPMWSGQGLIVLAVPYLIWGWIFFFLSSRQAMQGSTGDEDQLDEEDEADGPRPFWFSRPSWPHRAQRPVRRNL